MKSSFVRFSGAFVAAAVIAISTTMAFAKTTSWSEDYAKSVARGKAEKKLVLIDFTGSDWCMWCMKLDREVFSTPAFESYAKDHLVLMRADFPQARAQSHRIQAQNELLQDKYRIEGYPTVVVLNSRGKQIAALPYTEGGPKAFIAALKKLKK